MEERNTVMLELNATETCIVEEVVCLLSAFPVCVCLAISSQVARAVPCDSTNSGLSALEVWCARLLVLGVCSSARSLVACTIQASTLFRLSVCVGAYANYSSRCTIDSLVQH